MKSIVCVGLGFGDEGKGTIVDFLVRLYSAKLVIRYNGGAQCAHNVVTDDGRHHEFHQFGSGSLVPGCRTLLAQHVLVNPLVMLTEAVQLERIGVPNPMRNMFIDERCLITTPFHRAMNRLREYSRNKERHGSCGMGIGETMADALRRPHGAIRAVDMLDRKLMIKKLNQTRNEMVTQSKMIPMKAADWENEMVVKELSTFDVNIEQLADRYLTCAANTFVLDQNQIADLLDETATLIFEGAQGVLLDENHGFHPYTTWSTTTSTNAHLFLNEFGLSKTEKTEIGIMRAYMTRHGPGPFPTHSAVLSEHVLGSGEHNRTSDWQQQFRSGWLDLALLNYALRLNGTVDCLAVTHVDQLRFFAKWPIAVDYPEISLEPHNELMEQEHNLTQPLLDPNVRQDHMTLDRREVLETVETLLNTSIAITSEGATPSHKKFNEKLPVHHHLPHDHAHRAVRAGTRAK